MNGDDIHHETCFFVSFNDDICDQTMKHCFFGLINVDILGNQSRQWEIPKKNGCLMEKNI